MKALLCKQFGSPESLVVEDVDANPPGKGEVQIRVRACGVNFADTLMIQGLYQVKPPFPFSPGLEVSGEVIKVGEGVRQLQVGQRVIGLCQWGGMAETVNVPETMVMPIPSALDEVAAAGFPIAYGTSHVALAHRANLQAGETLLVLGAAGGVGLAAVEIGKRMGATVIACASTAEKLALTQQYGADFTINYTTENIRERIKVITNGKGVNVVYDPVGGDFLETCVRSMAWEGRYLVVGFTSGTIPQLPVNLTLLKNCAVMGVFWGAYALNKPQVLGDSLQTLIGWYAAGELKPHISQVLPLERGAEALWALMRRQALGKVVVKVNAY